MHEGRPGWLTQLLSLLSTSVTLQRSLLLLLFHHLHLEDLTQEQVCYVYLVLEVPLTLEKCLKIRRSGILIAKLLLIYKHAILVSQLSFHPLLFEVTPFLSNLFHAFHCLDQYPDTFQLKIDGIVLCELSKIEGLFLPVLEATQPNETPLPPTAYYLHNLPLDTPAALYSVCW